MNRDEIIKHLKALRSQDPEFPDGKILSSVSTKPLDVALDAFRIFADTNVLDEYIFKTPGILEKDCIRWLGRLLHNPGASGYITTGGTEANIFALFAARENSKKRGIIVPQSAHYSIHRAAQLLGLTVTSVGLDGAMRANATEIIDKINDDTLAVVLTAGTSAFGAVDPIEEVAGHCGDVFLHVDAASGGFILPFMERPPRFDFSLKNVDSITVDPHKMGQAPFPSGAILIRDKGLLERLKASPPYLPLKTYTLTGSRSGGAVAATWAAFNYLGYEGYKKIVGGVLGNTRLLYEELLNRGAGVVTKPQTNIIGVKAENAKDIVEKLNGMGWKVSLNRKPECVRVVVMPHTSKERILGFARDIESIL